MRRPHPRFDCRRNAWVTNAGGRLKILTKGPKSAETEQLAWDAFYEHMARLGRPVQDVQTPSLALGELADEYACWLKREVSDGRKSQATLNYYVHYLQKFIDAMGGNRVATAILPIELERYKTGWHSVQTVQRLYNWGVTMKLISENPFTEIEKPQAGERERVLTRDELARLLLAADRPFREFLVGLMHTIARPQEVRAFQWKHLVYDPVPMFVLRDYKARRLRKKDNKGLRKIPLDNRMLKLLAYLARKRQPEPEDYVFLNGRRRPWTGNAIRCRMRRLREKVGLGLDENGESVVAYTFRHTGGTRASRNGLRDKILADLMGHTNVATTHRYQHFQADDLHEAIQRANRRRV